MVQSLLNIATIAASIASVTANPVKRGWNDWNPWGQNQNQNGCQPWKQSVRVSYASMPQEQRKAYTDAIKCIMNQPSNLDPKQYPGAKNKYNDYAAIHIGQTSQVHLSGFFLTWHRYFMWLFEKDMRETCGYRYAFPYWDFSSGVDIHANPIFDGSAASLSGDGAVNNTGPVALGKNLVIPHGSGGGCVTTGPFANLQTPFAFIDPLYLVTGQPLPATAYNYQPWCLTRDLNSYVQQKYTNASEVSATVHSKDAATLEFNLNNAIGGSSLGVHSGAHFEVGGGNGQMGSIHVSVQDPVWWALHTQIDHIYTSWQINNPAAAQELYGTMTANNAPPSANVTLNTPSPNWGYFQPQNLLVKDLLNTTSGPFCYRYDTVIA